jgi:transposase-like protein
MCYLWPMNTPSDAPAPATLAEAIRHFADPDASLDFVVALRWPSGVACPHCGGAEPSYLKTRRIWKCRECRKQFSVKVGTVFEDSPIGLDKWLPALWMLANCKNGISSYELARDLGVTQKTAWFMLGRIRLAMQAQSFDRSRGIVEIDECFVGGKAKNMHRGKRKRVMGGKRTGASGKSGVIAAVVRGKRGKKSRVHARVLQSAFARPLGRMAQETVTKGSKVFTDSGYAHPGSLDGYIREMVNHSEREYVRGEVHTNSVENFWSLLKRSIKGTYVSVDPFHLFRYVDEQVFRFNERGATDHGRFLKVLHAVVGKKLSYAGLTGADLSPATT